MLCMSPIFSELSGSIGGWTMTHSRYGSLIARARVKPVDVNSNHLEFGRTMFCGAVKGWQTLTEDQRQDWITYAQGTPWQNKLGQTVYLTGQAMYISVRCSVLDVMPHVDVTYFNVAPCTPGLFPTPYVTFDCCTGEVIGVKVTVQNQDAELGMHCVVRISPAQNASRYYYKGPFIKDDEIILTSISAGAEDTAEFCPLCEGRYFFQIRCYELDNYNRVSSLMYSSFFACAAGV